MTTWPNDPMTRYISYSLPPEVQQAHLEAIEAAFAFDEESLTLPQLRELLYAEVLESSHELGGPAARCRASLQAADA